MGSPARESRAAPSYLSGRARHHFRSAGRPAGRLSCDAARLGSLAGRGRPARDLRAHRRHPSAGGPVRGGRLHRPGPGPLFVGADAALSRRHTANAVQRVRPRARGHRRRPSPSRRARGLHREGRCHRLLPRRWPRADGDAGRLRRRRAQLRLPPEGPGAPARRRVPGRGVVRRQGQAAQRCGRPGGVRPRAPRRRARRQGVPRGPAWVPVQALRRHRAQRAVAGRVRRRRRGRRVATDLHVLRRPTEGALRMSDAQATTTIAADPMKVYALVSDLPRMGEWSPENTGGRWIGGATGPEVGARFRGNNRRGVLRWSTTCEVTDATPGKRFAFDVTYGPLSISHWEYTFEPDGNGCRVTEEWTERRPAWMKFMSVPVMAVAARASHNARGMEATLAALKVAAEAG